MSRLEFSRSPYYDDFDQNKGFMRVLFQPKRTIQTRELNQLQSILSSQFENLTDHIFKFGSMVKSGSVRLKNYTPYVRLKDLTPSATAIDITKFIKSDVRGVTSKLLAEVILTAPKDNFDPATIFVNYKNTAIDGVTNAFLDGENVEVLDANGFVVYTATVRCPTCITDPDSDTIDPTGDACLFATEDSSFYVYGNIVQSPFQMIVLEKYSSKPTYKVGFDIIQTITTASDDQSLNDNSLGTPNSTAPGADRYTIQLILNKKPINDDDVNFVMVAKVNSGVMQEVRDKPQYAEIMDVISRRTYDESGDYTVRPFTINFKEHLSSGTGTNDGWKSAAEGGDANKFATMVSPGKAYVRGREVEQIAELIIGSDKARDTDVKRNTVVRPFIGTYFQVQLDPLSNTLPLTDIPGTIEVNDFGLMTMTNGPIVAGSPTGGSVGTCRVKSIQLISGFVGGTGLDIPTYALYVFDVSFTSGNTVLNVAGISKTGNGNQIFGANTVPDPIDSTIKIYEPFNNNLLFNIPFIFTKSIRDVDNPLLSNTSIVVLKKFVGAVNSSGLVVFIAGGNETFLGYNAAKWIGGLQQAAGQNYLPHDLTGIVTSSPSQITINVGSGDVGKDFVLTVEVLVSGIKEKTKLINTTFLTNVAGNTSSIDLLQSDVFRIVSITDTTAAPIDVTANYELDAGIRDNYYGLSQLNLKFGIAIPAPATTLDIEFDYFDHIDDGDYFSVDSYTTIINDTNEDFDYEDIPKYTTREGEVYEMSDTIDFRPTIGADGTFSGAGAIKTDIPIHQSNIIFDVEFYLSRIDTLCILDSGAFRMVKGIPALIPVPPAPVENSMPIYTIILRPFTFDVSRDISMAFIDNRRYTMNDIGRLDKRIKNLEYFVTFNLLEKETSDMTLIDSVGNERFKNGFIVDSFRDYLASNTKSPEFRCALDTQTGTLRPAFYTRNIEMVLNEASSLNFAKSSDLVTLPYTTTVWQSQPYSSKTVSVNPYFIYEIEGRIQLSPSQDIWKDVETEPALVVDIDTGADALRDVAAATGILGTQWNNWETTSVGRLTSVTQQTSSEWSNRIFNRRINPFASDIRTDTILTTSETTTTTNQVRAGINRQVLSEVTDNSLGTNVTSVNIIPFIRRRKVQFVASNMKPNTKLYAFFDGVDVTVDCRLLNRTTNSDLVTDLNGSIVGEFFIPNSPNKRFYTGDRVFRLTNTIDNNSDPDQLTTSAQVVYFAGGMQETRRETILSVRAPRLIETNSKQVRVNTSIDVEVEESTFETRVGNPILLTRRVGDDPLAQSFTVSEPSGLFLTGIELYFSEKSSDTPVWFQIRNMQNGFPATAIVPYSDITKNPGDVNVSTDASIATLFTFESPVYLQSDEEYCFVVGSSSETYRLHISKLGGIDISTGVTISTQPHIGSLFKSQNDKTWSPEQFEDIKFKIYRAIFDTSSTMKLVFENGDISQKSPLPENPFETENASNLVRVYHKNHGLTINDRVNLDLLVDTDITIHLSSGNLIEKQQLTGSINGGTGIVSKITYVGVDAPSGDDIYTIHLTDLTGFWAVGEGFFGNILYETFQNSEMLSALGVTPPALVHTAPIGTIPNGINGTYNGIPMTDLSTPDHLVQAVDHMDSFIIQITTPATSTGRTGGLGNVANGNVQIDTFNVQCQYLDYSGESTWTYRGIKHRGIGSAITNYAATGPFSFTPNENIDMIEPIKVANPTNQATYLGAGNKSLTIECTFKTDDAYVTPVINIETMAFTSITNRIDYNSCDNYSTTPNAGTWTVDCLESGSTARWIEETHPTNGVEIAKYVMKPVTLKTPATNIKVFLNVLQHIGTNVDVYYRTVAASIEADITTFSWIKVPYDVDIVSESDLDFKDAEITIPSLVNGAVLPEFKSFQIKLVLRAINSAQPPKVQTFRAIAVT